MVSVSENLTIKSKDGLEFDAYVARPKTDNAPVVVLIQEIFGVNKWLRGVADWLASEGFYAIAPDLFHRLEKGVQLTDQTEAEWNRAFELYRAFDDAKGVDDLQTTIEVARKMNGGNGKVGAMGFCLGGKMAFLVSTRTNADAAVSYYGVGIEQHLDESPKMPLLLHIASADEHVPPEAQEQIKQKLAGNKQVVIHEYPKMGHAFCRIGGQHYDEGAAKMAHARTVEFFKRHLG